MDAGGLGAVGCGEVRMVEWNNGGGFFDWGDCC